MSTELEAKLSVNSEAEVGNTEYKVTLPDIFGTILGLIFYVSDIFSDIILATWFFQKGYYLYGAFTITLIYLASGIDAIVSFLKEHYKNRGPRFWLLYITLSLVNAWGIKTIFSLIVSQYRAYKSQRVSIDTIEEENVRVARLKLCEAIFETLPQICLYWYLFGHIEELRSFKLPFVSEWDELQTTVDLFDVGGLLLKIKIFYFFMALFENFLKILRFKISTMAIFTGTGYLFFNGVIRGFSLPIIFMYPYHTAVIILLHVSVVGIYWYRNFSKKNQPVYKRWLNAIGTGMLWFIEPFCAFNHKKTFLALYIIYLIQNSVLFVTFIIYLNYGAIFLFGVLQAICLVCRTIHYFYYFEETKKAWNTKLLPDDEVDNLTVEAVSN